MKKAKVELNYSPTFTKDEKAIAEEQQRKRNAIKLRQKDYRKRKVEWKKLLGNYQQALKNYLTKKPKDTEIDKLIWEFTRKIAGDNCKVILRAFQVSFKVKDMDSNQYKLETAKVLRTIVKTSDHLSKLILLLGLLPYHASINNFSSLKDSLKTLNK